ncbi:MAG: GDP-mannose 4,6-dehydratase [Bacteroidota bacterium]
MAEILVTGGAGFISSVVAKKLLDKGEKVVAVDNLNDYYDIRLKEQRLAFLKKYKNFTFHQFDIEKKEKTELIFDAHNFKSVINLAARAGVRYSLENPHVYVTTNITGTLNLLEAMSKRNIKQFILASSSSLYAGEGLPFNETLEVNKPISPYAATKKAAEMMAYTYHSIYDIDTAVLRYFTVYGPYGRPDMSYFRFIKWIDEGIPIELFGDGTQTRDFTYVDDIAEGTIKSLDIKGYEIINLGGGKEPVSIKYMIEKIEEYLGKKAEINYREFQKTDMMHTGADISKAKKVLGWQPETGIDEGLKKTVDWYKENRSWLKEIII